MQKGQNLFRQQVIDELNTKLNGEILLKPGISFTFFIACCVFWFSIVYVICQKITVNPTRTIIGSVSKNNDASYAAYFLVPVEALSQINVGDEIPVKLLGISNSEIPFSKVKIAKINQTLTLSSPVTSNSMPTALVKVDAQLLDAKITFENYQLNVPDGLSFSFALNDHPKNLLSWINQYVFGDN